MKRALPLLAIIAATGCATVGPSPGGPTAAIGEVATVGGLRVRPVEIVEDSRCPANARCVWAGRLVLRAEISRPRFRQLRTFTLGTAQQVPGGQLRLVRVTPDKLAGPQPPGPPPRFTFAFD